MKRLKHSFSFKKGMAFVLSLSMVAGLVTAMSGGVNTVKAATNPGTEPSVTAFATKDQLMGDTFKPGVDGTAVNYGKLVFGKNSSGRAQEWYILGADSGVSGDNTIIFAASSIAANQKFNSGISDKTYSYGAGTGYGESEGSIIVNANHYGASDLRVTLQGMATNENYFTSVEQGLMNDTTVTTKDTKNNVTYTTTDKLYALAADGYDSSYKTIKAGSDNNTVLAMSSYSSSGAYFWLRSPSDTREILALIAAPAHYVFQDGVNNGIIVRPASNLNLSSVLFASAATAASSDTIKSGTIASDTAMTLRLDGNSKNIGSVTYNTTTGDIKAVKGTTSQTVALVVQGNDGTDDWYYSKQIMGTETINVSAIVSESNIPASIDLSTCKIWLEITDSTENLTYAVNATETTIKIIHSVAITDIDIPKADAALDTSALCKTTGVSSTTPQIMWTPNDTTAGYNTSYTASITLTAEAGYEFIDSTTAAILGNTATSVTKNADGTLTVTYKFNATAPTPSSDSVDYNISDGANSSWTQNSDISLSIRGSGEFSKFVGVKVDGTLVDVKNYTVKEGSTIVTLKADYLNTLSVGSHTIEIVWTDGLAGTTFIIKEDTSGDGNNNQNDNKNSNQNDNKNSNLDDNDKKEAPKTGDDSHLVLWITLFGVSLAGLLPISYTRKKKENE